jgi:hypothetical protein
VGTNYYFKRTRRHIGKNSYQGGKMGTFIWDIEPSKLKDLNYVVRNGVIIVDEYGTTFTLSRFRQMLKKRYHHTSDIGKGFS